MLQHCQLKLFEIASTIGINMHQVVTDHPRASAFFKKIDVGCAVQHNK